jgi:hypothetical protein
MQLGANHVISASGAVMRLQLGMVLVIAALASLA